MRFAYKCWPQLSSNDLFRWEFSSIIFCGCGQFLDEMLWQQFDCLFILASILEQGNEQCFCVPSTTMPENTQLDADFLNKQYEVTLFLPAKCFLCLKTPLFIPPQLKGFFEQYTHAIIFSVVQLFFSQNATRTYCTHTYMGKGRVWCPHVDILS